LFVESWFKSYYVVWKRDAFGGSLSAAILFKSYYVVWKLLHLNSFFYTYDV